MKKLINCQFSVMVITVALLISACSSFTYNITNKDQVAKDIGYQGDKLPFHMHPTDMDAPFLTEAGEVYLNGNIGKSSGLAAGLALSDKTYMILRYSSYYDTQSGLSGKTYIEADYNYFEYNGTGHSGDTLGDFDYSQDLNLHSSNLELGFGWNKKLGNDFMNEISFGGGTGKIHNDYTYDILGNNAEFNEKRKYYLVYLQDDIGWVTNNLEASISGRFNSYFFSDREFQLAVSHEVPDYQRNAFSLEGSFRIALGLKFLKPYVEITGVVPVASPEIVWEPYMIKGGIISRF